MSFMDERRRMLMAALSQANPYPKYTYSGNAQFIDDGDGNWRIKFLSGGTFKLLNSDFDIDVFLVGGGGGGGTSGKGTTGYGGGGGGYTTTVKGVSLKKGTVYSVVVGAGGVGRAAGESRYEGRKGSPSSFAVGSNTYTANGGDGSYYSNSNGGKGGSGGGAGAYFNFNSMTAMNGGNGGSDGSDGLTNYSSHYGGTGQHTTTREFGETSGTLYAGGGGGAGNLLGSGGYGGAGGGSYGGGGGKKSGIVGGAGGNGTANTGGGGGCGGPGNNANGGAGGSGGSGIVIIRNARGG